MPRRRTVPSYCLHRASGRAVVRLDGVDKYLGAHGSPESFAAYERAIAEWRAADAATANPGFVAAQTSFDLSVCEVLYRYRHFALSYYRVNGQPSKELQAIKYSLRPVRQLYGRTKLCEFGPLALKAVRQHMVDQNLSRKLINSRINRVKRFVKWAVSEELAPPSLYEALRTVSGLRYGRTAARETEPIRPVPDVWVQAVLPHVSSPVRAMIEIQRLTGARPCEMVIMRAVDIDMSAEIWIYEPAHHKNQWRGHRRLIPLGPKAQTILRPFLLAESEYLFSPIAAEHERNANRRKNRKTPITPSQAKRKPKAESKRRKRQRYDVDSYRRAVEYGIKRANKLRSDDDQIGHWFPLQLRHSRATEIRKLYGLEGAQVALGHANAAVTEVYAEKNQQLAAQIARVTG